MSRLGKLPPLQSIGRAKSFDFDEPPDEDSDVDNLIQEYEAIEHGYRYEAKHALTAAESFGRSYKVLQPGMHICKRSATGASSFSHCKEAVRFAQHYHDLRQLLESRAKLEFVREYCARVSQSSFLVRQIEGIVQEEHLTWQSICRNNFQSPPTTKLECLGSLCEDLRVNMHHWNSLKQLVHTNQWLRSQLPILCVELEQVQNKLNYLRSCAVWWIERLIHIGFRVVAHCDPNHLSQDTLWSITRGLEEYNSIVNVLKGEQSVSCSISAKAHTLTAKSSTPALTRSFPSAVHINSFKNLIDSIKTVPFSRVLTWLASERSKYAAAMTHQFFTSNNQFLMRVRSGRLPAYTWGEEKNGKVRPSSAIETSDYYTQSGSNVSLGSAMLRIGTVTAPDLSKEESPVAEFAAREHEFAIKFLQIVSRATTLLKRPSKTIVKRSAVGFRSGTPTRSIHGSHEALHINARNSPLPKSKSDHHYTNSAYSFTDEDNISLASDISMASASRKSVSWCDASDINLMRKLADKYMKQLWEHYERHLTGFFRAPILRGASMARMQLGNVLLAPDMVVMMVVTMVQQTCLKDIFPPGAEHALSALSQSLMCTAARADWHVAYCQALGSRGTDKCQPRPLQDGTYSTSTARFLRDAYQPLHTWLLSLQLPRHAPENGSEPRAKPGARSATSPSFEDDPADSSDDSPNQRKKGGHSAETKSKIENLQSVLQHYVMTSILASQWCITKVEEALSQASIASFLLLTQSDLKMVCDELSFVLRYSQPACTVWSSEKQISALWTQLSDFNSQLQKASSAAVKSFSLSCKSHAAEFFQDNLPRPKVWRKKASPEEPAAHNEYIEHALGEVLAPVVSGIGKLPHTSQISSVSIAVTALCEAWTEHILKHKIRFSYTGAYQLKLDALFIQQWLSDRLDVHVRHSVLALDVFKYVNKVVELLLQQPHAGNGKVTKGNAVSHCDSGLDYTTDTPVNSIHTPSSGDSHTRTHGRKLIPSPRARARNERERTPTPTGNRHDQRSRSPLSANTKTEIELSPVGQRKNRVTTFEEKGANGTENGHHSEFDNKYKVPNADQWLALRVQGGSRQWPKLPNCFQTD